MNQLSFSNIILGGDVQIKWRNIQHINQHALVRTNPSAHTNIISERIEWMKAIKSNAAKFKCTNLDRESEKMIIIYVHQIESI